jgi:hypothetical protein
MTARVGLGVALAAVALAGCGKSEPVPPPTKTQVNPSGMVGSTLPVSDSSGTKIKVTVTQMLNPATGANAYATPKTGKYFVGVQLRILNAATTKYQNNANNETTITLGSGHTVKADYNAISGCSNFDNGQVTLSGGASKTGCVTFQVPNGESIATIRYGNTTFPGTTAQWRVS